MKSLVTFFITIFSISLKAQLFYNSGHIVLNNQQKLDGRIKQIDNTSISFVGGSKKITTYSVDDIISYSIENIPFIVKNITFEGKEKKVFLKEVLIGTVSLYEIPKAVDDNKFVILTEKGDFILLKKDNAAPEIRKLVYKLNNLAISQKTTNTNFRYNQSFIKSLIKEYIQITEPNSKIREPKSPIILSPYFMVGLSSNSFRYTGYYGNLYVSEVGKMPSSIFAPFGVGLSFNPQKTISFDIEAIYNQGNSQKRISYFTGTMNFTDVVTFSEKSLSIPVHLKFNISQKTINSYIKAGPKYTFEIPIKGSIDRGGSFETNLFKSDQQYGVGYDLCFGVSKEIKKNSLSLEYRFSQHSVHEGVTKILNSASHHVMLGFAFLKK